MTTKLNARRKLRALTVGLLLATSATMVPPANAQEPSPPDQTTTTLFGVHEFSIAAKGATPNRTASVNEVGASFIRLPISWHLMEAEEKGETPGWFWSELDADIAAAEAAGLDVLLTFGQTPCWASSDPAKDCSTGDDTYLSYLPNDPQDYADALGRMVERYGDRIMAWEVWNEPNLGVNLRSTRCGPSGPDRGICYRPASQNDLWQSFGDMEAASEYAALARLGSAAAVQVDPDAKVLVGSIAGGDVEFLNDMYAAGLGEDYYAVSMHPYTGPIPDDVDGMSYGPNECPAGQRNAAFWCFARGVEAVHDTMVDHGDWRNIWFTEFGFASTISWNGSGVVGQGTHLRQAVKLIESWSFVPVAAWYQLIDQGPDDREGTFGLFDQDGQIKPAGEQYRDALTGGPITPPEPPASDAPVLVWPVGEGLDDPYPLYEWTSVPNAVEYLVWVNQYGPVDDLGRISVLMTPQQAGCEASDICEFFSELSIEPYGEWWVTAYLADGTQVESEGASFEQ